MRGEGAKGGGVEDPQLSTPLNAFTLYPTAYQPTPEISRKESFLTPCCYIVFVNWYIYESHTRIQTKNSKFEQNFRISKFCEIENTHHLDKRKIATTFEDTGLKFYMQA